jgi:prevent-host-death family protein
MKIASITQTKNNLSAYIDLVRNGETILIMDRNRPVARLEPAVQDESADDEGRLTRLERSGLIRRAKNPKGIKALFATPAIKLIPGVSLVKALLADREEER